MPGSEYQGMAPGAVFVGILLSAALSWLAQAWLYRFKRADTKASAKIEADDRLIIHRDELTFSLLTNARLEMASARIEVDDLRDEVRKLRSMENHFFFFEQSLDHLEALLRADSVESRATAERAARAFLNRMRRLKDAKGTIANETQRAASEISLFDRDGKLGKAQDKGGKP